MGHIITPDGVSTDPNKIESMEKWPTPKNVKQLRGCLGLTGYYKKFICGYGVLSKPLTNLLRRDQFKWNDDAEGAFISLKKTMTLAPVLAVPYFTIHFILETNASGVGVRAVLMQHGSPIAYMSKTLCEKNHALSIYEREFLAVLMAVQKWKYYLRGHKFYIRTDQQSSRFLLDQKITSSLQQKWVAKLLEFNYETQYKKGTENRELMFLSRVQDESSMCSAMTTITPDWIQEVIASYEDDEYISGILVAKNDSPNS